MISIKRAYIVIFPSFHSLFLFDETAPPDGYLYKKRTRKEEKFFLRVRLIPEDYSPRYLTQINIRPKRLV
ncbi:hypothetical protein HR11_10075 [Porphyromonas macacae]|uniref:Uncharacterized protein n=1 Tax=Porphyromonas macacae TaxID=28115 RepID=A0A0A2GB43_9PORP|nr:hypothetical protein HQ47_10045 [Porphyromonas macacae]KGN97674.1 hypothetical protein HR11_10075 [Porphyromonas macacae]